MQKKDSRPSPPSSSHFETYQSFLSQALLAPSIPKLKQLKQELEIFPLAGDASTRRYFRVVLNGSESWVLMVWDPFDDNGRYPFLNVANHFREHGINVPQVMAKSPEQGLVLLEDLGDLTLERKFWENQDQSRAMPYYRMALDELIRIHYDASRGFYNQTENRDKCVAYEIAFDTEKLLWEMNYARKHYLNDFLGIQLKNIQAKALDQIFLQICQTLDAEPKFIAHRDYHSRNVMIKLGRVRVIDFQDARMGAIQYDLVSLLRDSYVQIDEHHRHELLNYYIDNSIERFNSLLNSNYAVFSRENFERIFEVQTIQRCFKACGSFASFFNMRSDTRYLKYLVHTMQTVYDSLKLFPQWNEFLQILEDNGVTELTANKIDKIISMNSVTT